MSQKADEFSLNLQKAALLVAQKIKDPQKKNDILSQIAYNYSCLQKPEKIAEILAQELAVVKTIEPPTKKVKKMGELAGRYHAYGLSQQADRILSEALETIAPVIYSEEKFESLHEIAFRYALAGEEKKAFQVIDRIENTFQKTVIERYILDILVREQIEKGQDKRAIEIIEETDIDPFSFENTSPELSGDRIIGNKIHELTKLALKYKNDEPEKAAKIFDRAIEMAQSISNPSVRNNNLIAVARVYIEIDKPEKGIDLLKEILQQEKELQTTENNLDRNASVNYFFNMYSIVEWLAKADRPERALEVIQEIENNPNYFYNKVNALLEISKSFFKLGRIERANEILEQAREIIPLSSKDDDYEISNLISIAFTYIEYKQNDRAKQILRQILQQYENIDYEQLESISYLLTELGEYDLAFETAKLAGYEEQLIRLAVIYADRGLRSREKKVIDAITYANGKSDALGCIGIYFTKNGYEDKGWEYILKALQIAKDNEKSDVEDRSGSISYILKNYIRETRKCDRLPQLLKTIEDGLTRIKVFVELSIQLKIIDLKIEDPALISQLFLEIEAIQDRDSQETALALVKIADLYANIGQYDRALEVVSNIKDAWTRSLAFVNMASVYRENCHQVAIETQKKLDNIVEQLNLAC